ncbi:MAG: winged helix-turn-helix domain-containing protein [Lachnospiraceae bacterium]|nr:winged helix-turn-helix domain-containing protein [Lachnospiraceae bacterium]
MMNIGNTVMYQKQILTPELEKKILAAQTKQSDNILRALYQKRYKNKELAHEVGISVSALSNVLQKIKTSQLGLLVVEQDGRNTYYSLSELGVQYTEKYLMNNSSNKKVVELDSMKISDYVRDAISKIHNIQIQVGDDWQFVLDEFLMSYNAATNDSDYDSCYIGMINCIKQIILDENWEGLNLVYKELGNDILRKRIENVFEKMMGIKSLCILDENDWKLAYEILDDFFQSDGKYINVDSLERLNTYQIAGEDIRKIFNVLKKLINEIDCKNVSKKDLYNIWGELFMPHERLLYYFVEKCINE